MQSHPLNDPTRVPVCIKAMREVGDPRDNRGKRHDLAFVLVAVTLAIMVGRSKMSSIHRYIKNKIGWLRKITGASDATPVSRAHLPRLLARPDWDEVNQVLETHFGVRVELNIEKKEWTAIDGKTLRGTTGADEKQGERGLFAATHNSRTVVAQRKMDGPKSSEITAVRELLHESGLEKGRVTLDALHCNPTTTTQIHQAGGTYLIQVKDNQEVLREQLQAVAADSTSLGTQSTVNKARGRIETRCATFFALTDLALANRWAGSGLHTLVVMERTTVEVAKQKTTRETSYYVTNQQVQPAQHALQSDLAQAIRGHWSIEADNWIRDVTFNEDQVKTKDGNQAQILASLRTLAIRLLRKAKLSNFQAALEDFTDCPSLFESFLRQVEFL